eukprot:3828666-Amphidinium_carterae.1
MPERWPKGEKLPIEKWTCPQRKGMFLVEMGSIPKLPIEQPQQSEHGEADKFFWAYREQTLDAATSSSPAKAQQPFPVEAKTNEAPSTTDNLFSCGCDGTHREPTEVDIRMPVMPMATAEQRWVWREFLQETISRTQVTNMFEHFDVDADPPSYQRPPPSRNPMPQLYSRSQSRQLDEGSVHCHGEEVEKLDEKA